MAGSAKTNGTRSSSSRFKSNGSVCHPVWLELLSMPNKDRSFHEAPETAGGDAALRLDHRGNIKKTY